MAMHPTSMIVASPENMLLEPNECIIDPALTGVAYIQKRIAGITYEAWVDARFIKRAPILTLPCFPSRLVSIPGRYEPLVDTVSVRINEWTTWRIPVEDFNDVQFMVDMPQTYIFYTEQ